jgi:diphthamide synthase (EF-2-diphthine--ammonia ligase)
VYKSLLDFGALLRRDLRDLGPRDMIDLQSFLWVQGSEEYAGRTFKSALTTRIATVSAPGPNPQSLH